jgi:Cu/Zn superoxide dismutase
MCKSNNNKAAAISEAGSHFQPMRKNHHVNNPSDVLKSQPTNSSGSKKRKGSKILLE